MHREWAEARSASRSGMRGPFVRGEVATPNLSGNHDAASEARHPLFRNDDTAFPYPEVPISAR